MISPQAMPTVGGEPILVPTDAKSWPAIRVLGIDIGLRGAAALIDEEGNLLDLADLPTVGTGPAHRPEISPHLFAGIVRRWHPTRAWVEWIGPRSTDGPKSAFAFGGARSCVETVLACCAVPFQRITPSDWKRTARIPPGRDMKPLARGHAIRRWPAHAEAFARTCDHDRAEASLIAVAGLMREKAGR